MNRKGIAPIFIVLIVAAILIAGGLIYYEVRMSPLPEESHTPIGQTPTPQPTTPPPALPSTSTSPSKTTLPVITLLSPSSGKIKTVVIVTGSGFSPASDGNTVYFNGIDIGKATLISHATLPLQLSFVVPSYWPTACPQPTYPPDYTGPRTVVNCDPIPVIPPGSYPVAVKTAGGTSNTMIFTVVMSGQ